MVSKIDNQWSPICSPSQSEQIKNVVLRIYHQLAAKNEAEMPLSLGGGSAGICLFWQQVQRCYELPVDELLMRYFSDIFNRLADSQFTPGLYAGLSGIGWLTDQVSDAISTFKELLDLNPDLDLARYYLGTVYEKQADWESALEAFLGIDRESA